MCHSADRSLQKIDTHIARFPARSQSFSAMPASCPSGERKAMRRLIGSISATPAASPEKPGRDREAICSGKPQVDRIDAEVLAHFAEVMRPEPRPLPDAASRELSALFTRHHQLIEIMTAQSNRGGRAPKTHIDQRAPASELRSKCRTGKYSRQLRSAWTEAWEGPDSPGPLPMPFQTVLSEPALRAALRAAERGNNKASELVTYWVGQCVGLVDSVKSSRAVVQSSWKSSPRRRQRCRPSPKHSVKLHWKLASRGGS
jgi:hypothetical protein